MICHEQGTSRSLVVILDLVFSNADLASPARFSPTRQYVDLSQDGPLW